MSEPIHIVFCVDDHYVQHLAVLIKSIECNHKTDSRLYFHLFDGGMSPQKLNTLKSLEIKGTLNIYKIDFRSFEGLPIWGHFSASIYSRFLVERTIPETIDRLIYLDIDMIALSDIQDLWDQTLEKGVLLKASLDTGSNSKDIKEKYDLKKYFNSGVLLIDLKEWRARQICNSCIDFIRSHKSLVECPDQDALNVVLKGLWTELDFSWNFHSGHYVLKPLPKDAVVNIVHFAGIYKPWQYVSLDPFRDRYFQYLKLTPWKDFQYSDKTMLNIFKRFFFLYVPAGLIIRLSPLVHRFRAIFHQRFRKFIQKGN